MTRIWMGLIVLSALSASVLFLTSLRRWPVVGFVSVAVNILIAWEFPYPPALANVVGMSIYFLDILCIAFMIIGVSRLPQLRRNMGVAGWFWLGVGLLLSVSLLRGVVENPFGSTVNEFRSFFYPFAAMTWAMSLTWRGRLVASLMQRFALALGWGLVVVAGYHFSRFGLGSPSGFIDSGTGLEQNTRPLVSGQAFVLLLCAIVCLWFWRIQNRVVLLVSALAFLSVLLVVQQRGVWSAAILSAIAVFLVSRTRTKLTMLGLGVLAAIFFGFILTANLAPDLLNRLEDAGSDSGTYDARVTSWLNLIAKSVSKGFDYVFFGAPMGGGFGRFEGAGRWVLFAPHNWYVTIYLRVGILGLSLLVLFLAFAMAGILRRRANMAALAILVAIVTFGWDYSWPWYISVFVGWATATGTTGVAVTGSANPTVVSATRGPSKLVQPYGEI